MTDNTGSTDNINELTILKLLLEQIQNNNKEQNSSINTVTTLWIILFSIVVIQKIFKYIIRPTYRNKNKNKNNSTSVSSNTSESV